MGERCVSRAPTPRKIVDDENDLSGFVEVREFSGRHFAYKVVPVGVGNVRDGFGRTRLDLLLPHRGSMPAGRRR